MCKLFHGQMMILVHMISILLAVIVSASLELTVEWNLWKSQHGKRYWSLGEEMARHRVWLTNREYISNHNLHAEQHGYTLALNHFGDLVYTNLSIDQPLQTMKDTVINLWVWSHKCLGRHAYIGKACNRQNAAL